MRCWTPSWMPPVDTPCLGVSYPFDVLIDQNHGPEWEWCLWEARELCERCEVRVDCHSKYAGEPWVAAINRRRWQEPA